MWLKCRLAALLLPMTTLAIATAGDPSAVNQLVESARTQNYSVFATYPIFGQILGISFPRDFVPVSQATQGATYLQESVLKGETAEEWTQMLSISGAQGAALKPKVSLESAEDYYVNGYSRRCPETFATIDLGDGGLNGLDSRAVVVSCGSVRSGLRSESMLLIILKGTEDYYTIQWAVRRPASSTPLQLARSEWMSRLHRLQPIKLCPLIPGEAPPYPSCIGNR